MVRNNSLLKIRESSTESSDTKIANKCRSWSRLENVVWGIGVTIGLLYRDLKEEVKNIYKFLPSPYKSCSLARLAKTLGGSADILQLKSSKSVKFTRSSKIPSGSDVRPVRARDLQRQVINGEIR